MQFILTQIIFQTSSVSVAPNFLTMLLMQKTKVKWRFNMKKIAIGDSDFKSVLTRNCYYIDKTLYIKTSGRLNFSTLDPYGWVFKNVYRISGL